MKAMIPYFPLKTTQELDVIFHTAVCFIHSRACPNFQSPLSEVGPRQPGDGHGLIPGFATLTTAVAEELLGSW